METQSANIMGRFWRTLNAGEYNALDAIVAAEYVDHFPQAHITNTGREGVKQTFRLQYLGMARPRYTVESILDDDDMIATRFTVSDTGVGNANQVVPTGLRFELHGLYVCRIDRGRIREGGALFDDLPLLQLALGSAPRSA